MAGYGPSVANVCGLPNGRFPTFGSAGIFARGWGSPEKRHTRKATGLPLGFFARET